MKCDHINQINFSNENSNRNELYYEWMQLCSCMKLTTCVIGHMDKIGLMKFLNITNEFGYMVKLMTWINLDNMDAIEFQ
jgi:hypothetical protein